MIFKNNATYRFICRADTIRALNVYASAGTAPRLSNVCLWKSSPSDIGQQWIYKKSGSNKYFVCKANPSVALDMYTGSVSGQNNVNAHVYAPSDTSYLAFEDTDSGYIKIKLARYSNKYLTANQGKSGTSNGRTTHDPGNVYWYAGGLTDHSQEWKPILVDDGGSSGGKYDKNYLIYPTKTMNITQSYNGSYNHYQNSGGIPKDYPIDEACEDSGRSWFYCPCDEMKVVHVYLTGSNTVWLESTSPVVTPTGTYSTITMLVTHPEDEDMININNKTFKRGEPMFREGKDGWATGNHFHISVGTGHYNGAANGTGWEKNSSGAWVLTPTGKTLKPEEAFYVDPSFTTIKNNTGINFKRLP